MPTDDAGGNRSGRRYAPDPAEPEGKPPTHPVDHVPDAAVSSETTPPDESGHADSSSGTGVPGADHADESLPPGEVGGVSDPVHAMEGERTGDENNRSLLYRVRRFFSHPGRHGRR